MLVVCLGRAVNESESTVKFCVVCGVKTTSTPEIRFATSQPKITAKTKIAIKDCLIVDALFTTSCMSR